MGVEDGTAVMESRSQESKGVLSYQFKAGIFLSSIAGIGVLSGFSGALASVKKQDPKHFAEGVTPRGESGVRLAVRALTYGTLLSVAGTGLFCFGIWKLSGARDFKEFRETVGSLLPRVPKNNPPQSRTEFEGIRDFLTYVIEESEKEKKDKENNNKNV